MNNKSKVLCAILTSLTLTSCSLAIKPLRQENFNQMKKEKAPILTTSSNSNNKTSGNNGSKGSVFTSKRFNIDLTSYENAKRGEVGSYVSGVKSLIHADGKEVSLTFNLKDDGFNQELYNYLVENKVPGTIFVSSDWIKNNTDIFNKIVKDKALTIEALGPSDLSFTCAKSGQKVENSKIQSLLKACEEVVNKIEESTNKEVSYIRAANSNYDEAATKLLKEAKLTATSSNIDMNLKGNYDEDVVIKNLKKTVNGSIINFNLDEKNSDDLAMVKKTLSYLKGKGYNFSVVK